MVSLALLISADIRLMFPKHEAVDGLWSTIAQSVANGPLKEAGVFLAKVAPTPSSPSSDFVSRCEDLKADAKITHVICMYMHDVYDLAVVRKVSHKSFFLRMSLKDDRSW